MKAAFLGSYVAIALLTGAMAAEEKAAAPAPATTKADDIKQQLITIQRGCYLAGFKMGRIVELYQHQALVLTPELQAQMAQVRASCHVIPEDEK